MTQETKNTRLLRLYKLLWEQIKDKELMTFGLCNEVYIMREIKTLNHYEHHALKDHIKDILNCQIGYAYSLDEQGTSDRKAFVQRMIKELENDK